MSHNFLLEIGLEEIPAHVVTPSIKQLETRVSNFLADQRISYQTIKSFSTPRRLALQITGLADGQPDIEEEVKGPAKKIALDSEGNWSKAAQGFVRGQGVTVDDITFKELKGVEYVYVTKFIKGQAVETVLPELKKQIMAMTFPTTMKWANHSFEYVRPIKWIVALLDNEIIPFTILDITTDRKSRGHRFLGQEITLENATSYEEALNDVFVIADATKRKALIRKQIEAIRLANNWQVVIDEDLLEEVNNLVEWPTTFTGSFKNEYLDVPDEVLITSMKEHQRFFYVTDANGNLLPHFIAVRNGNSEFLDNVIRGNEKVLTARLEDAKFFYNEDQKQTIADYMAKVKKLAFHDKIGSVYQHMQRVSVIAQEMGKKIGLSTVELADLQRASEIYKFDLVTGMVGEFSELQGIMGEKYAQIFGETNGVAQAIREHYMPISAEGALPTSKVGAILALADKYDAIVTFFAAGMIPSGANDPYALRRSALGMVRILKAQQWHIDFTEITNELLVSLSVNDTELPSNVIENINNITNDITRFMQDRVKQILNTANTRHDIVEAVSHTDDILTMFEQAKVLMAHKDDDNFRNVIEALTRAIRLTKQNNILTTKVEVSLFEDPTEDMLFKAVEKVTNKTATASLSEIYAALVDLAPTISAYFDANMIMDDNEAVKINRLNQLSAVAKLASQLGELDKLIVK